MIKQTLLVFIGGGIGSGLRFILQKYLTLLIPISFPIAILFINLIGSFLIGILWGLSIKSYLNNMAILFLITGICGGFTTFSTFSLDNILILKQGNFFLFFLNILLSILLCISATAIGWSLTK